MRRWRRSIPRRGRRYHRGPIGRILFVVILLCTIFLFLDWSLRPVVGSMVANQAKIASIEAINESVMQELGSDEVTYGDLIKIERSTSGQILAITTEMTQMNRLKAAIIQRVQGSLGDHIDTSVPLGTLLGSELLHGRGPAIPVRLTLSGNVTADFKSSFESAGINQTKHCISLRVHTSIYSFLPPAFNGTTEIETDVPIAETIIVGDVPQLMTNLK